MQGSVRHLWPAGIGSVPRRSDFRLAGTSSLGTSRVDRPGAGHQRRVVWTADPPAGSGLNQRDGDGRGDCHEPGSGVTAHQGFVPEVWLPWKATSQPAVLRADGRMVRGIGAPFGLSEFLDRTA
jgi:hypothetical protein